MCYVKRIQTRSCHLTLRMRENINTTKQNNPLLTDHQYLLQVFGEIVKDFLSLRLKRRLFSSSWYAVHTQILCVNSDRLIYVWFLYLQTGENIGQEVLVDGVTVDHSPFENLKSPVFTLSNVFNDPYDNRFVLPTKRQAKVLRRRRLQFHSKVHLKHPLHTRWI